jgi:hypothetical protein
MNISNLNLLGALKINDGSLPRLDQAFENQEFNDELAQRLMNKIQAVLSTEGLKHPSPSGQNSILAASDMNASAMLNGNRLPLASLKSDDPELQNLIQHIASIMEVDKVTPEMDVDTLVLKLENLVQKINVVQQSVQEQEGVHRKLLELVEPLNHFNAQFNRALAGVNDVVLPGREETVDSIENVKQAMDLEPLALRNQDHEAEIQLNQPDLAIQKPMNYDLNRTNMEDPATDQPTVRNRLTIEDDKSQVRNSLDQFARSNVITTEQIKNQSLPIQESRPLQTLVDQLEPATALNIRESEEPNDAIFEPVNRPQSEITSPNTVLDRLQTQVLSAEKIPSPTLSANKTTEVNRQNSMDSDHLAMERPQTQTAQTARLTEPQVVGPDIDSDQTQTVNRAAVELKRQNSLDTDRLTMEMPQAQTAQTARLTDPQIVVPDIDLDQTQTGSRSEEEENISISSVLPKSVVREPNREIEITNLTSNTEKLRSSDQMPTINDSSELEPEQNSQSLIKPEIMQSIESMPEVNIEADLKSEHTKSADSIVKSDDSETDVQVVMQQLDRIINKFEQIQDTIGNIQLTRDHLSVDHQIEDVIRELQSIQRIVEQPALFKEIGQFLNQQPESVMATQADSDVLPLDIMAIAASLSILPQEDHPVAVEQKAVMASAYYADQEGRGARQSMPVHNNHQSTAVIAEEIPLELRELDASNRTKSVMDKLQNHSANPPSQEFEFADKNVSRFAMDLANLNRAMLMESRSDAPSMTKHFAHPEWNQEMGEKILWMMKQDMPSAELRLNPRHLGPVTIRLDVNQDQVSVAFTAQHAAVKDAIEASMPKLREMFTAQNLNLTDVNVSQDSSSEQRSSRPFSQMDNQMGQRRQGQPDGAELSEEHNNLAELTEEIETSRAMSANGLLSIFA